MFRLYAQKNKLTVLEREMITSGSADIYNARLEFSEDWDGLERIVSFDAGDIKAPPILLDNSNECDIPPEVLTKHGVKLNIGVVGRLNGDVVLPTIYASLGTIMKGAEISQDGHFPATPELWRQELKRKQDKLTGLPGQIVVFDEEGNAVAGDIPSGGDGKDGFSPIVEVSAIDGGHQVTITDANGAQSFNVMDGVGSSVSGATYKFGHGLKKEGDTVYVDMASDENPDKTLPISAAAVDVTVGNIETLLKIIRGV